MASTTRLPRSALCWLRFSDSASRTVASVTKPSVMSSLPSGSLLRFCSISAMRSWSSLMTPFWISSLPRGSLGCSAMTLNARPPGPGPGPRLARRVAVEIGGAVLRQRQRLLVIADRQLGLVQTVQADGQVEGVIGVARRGRVGAEVALLGVRPAALVGVQIAEREMQRARFGILPQHRLQALLALARIALVQADQAGQRVGVVGIQLQQAQIH